MEPVVSQVTFGAMVNGGDDIDVLEIAASAALNVQVAPGLFLDLVLLNQNIISGIETLRFDSQEGEAIRVVAAFHQASGITTLEGRDGTDVLILSVDGSSPTNEYTLKAFNLSGWGEDDRVTLNAGPVLDVTFNTENHDGTYVLLGGGGSDILNGSGGIEEINGNAGNDSIDGNGNADVIDAGAGDDTIMLDTVTFGAEFHGGEDNDVLEIAASAALNVQVAPGLFLDLVLLNQNIISGIETLRFDSQEGEAIRVVAAFHQASGITTLEGRDGTDVLILSVDGSSPTNEYTLKAFNLSGWGEDDRVTLNAGPVLDVTFNTENHDGTYVLLGGGGNDILNGSGGIEEINGNAGNDSIDGNGNADVIDAGAGDDTIMLDTVTFGAEFHGGDDNDTLRMTASAMATPALIPQLPFDLLLLGQNTISGIERLWFDSQAGETLRVGTRVEQLTDVTTVKGGAGTDVLIVGMGDDGTIGEYTLKALTLETWEDGVDAIVLEATQAVQGVTLNAENHAGTYTLVGSAHGDTLNGSSSKEVLNGGDGEDVIHGNGGEDTINGGNGQDTAVFLGASTDYTISVEGDGSILVGIVRLYDVEKIEFSDGIFTLTDQGGLVADGYVAGAKVWIDDGNGVWDNYEPFAITDENGDFNLVSYLTGPLLATGGTNIDTGQPNTIVLSAPEGSTVVNPLTTLVQAIIETGADPIDAQNYVKDAFNLDPGLDLTSVDLIAASAGGDDLAFQAQKAATSIAEVLSTVAESSPDGVDGALDDLADAVGDGTIDVDLSDPIFLEELYEDAGVSDPAGAAQETQETVQQIEEAESLSDIASAQMVETLGTKQGDTLSGDDGEQIVNDKISGSNGGDVINGGGGDNRLFGENGDDLIIAGDGKDFLNGGKGNDILEAGDGNDVLVGGKGIDSLKGDDLPEDEGTDYFVFSAGDSKDGDYVLDFDPSEDLLFFSDGLIATGVQQGQANGSALVILSDGGWIELSNPDMDLSGLQFDDIPTATSLPLWAQTWPIT